MTELGFRYRWDSPAEWLEEKRPDRYDVLHTYGVLDSDTIQNVDQDEMSSDGYFEPLAGVYLIDFDPEPEVLDALKEAQWEAEPLYQELTTLGCKFLELRIQDNGICSFIMACPCPMATISAFGSVIDAQKVRSSYIDSFLRDPDKRKLIEEVLR